MRLAPRRRAFRGYSVGSGTNRSNFRFIEDNHQAAPASCRARRGDGCLRCAGGCPRGTRLVTLAIAFGSDCGRGRTLQRATNAVVASEECGLPEPVSGVDREPGSHARTIDPAPDCCVDHRGTACASFYARASCARARAASSTASRGV